MKRVVGYRGLFNNRGREDNRDLRGAVFIACSLEEFDWNYKDLSHSVFISCEFRYAALLEANFEGAIFHKTRFDARSMVGVNMAGAEFLNCSFSSANLTDANFKGAAFGEWCDEQGAAMAAAAHTLMWQSGYDSEEYRYRHSEDGIWRPTLRTSDPRHNSFMHCNLSGTDFREASLPASEFAYCSARRGNHCNVEGAILSKLANSSLKSPKLYTIGAPIVTG